jgi:hypothetical protein
MHDQAGRHGGESMSRKSAKFERCVRAVKARGTAYNPWAVCRAQLGESMDTKISKKSWEMMLENIRTHPHAPIPHFDPLTGRKLTMTNRRALHLAALHRGYFSSENPIGKMLAWTLGLGAVAVAGIAGIVVLASSKKTTSTPTKPAPSTPVWTSAAINPQTSSVWLPVNSTFAISVPGDDAGVGIFVQNLNALIQAGVITNPQSTQAGQAAPAGWPADHLGTNAFRYTGVISAPAGSSVASEGGVGVVVDQSTLAWLFAGVTS